MNQNILCFWPPFHSSFGCWLVIILISHQFYCSFIYAGIHLCFFFMFWYTGAAHRNRDIILSVSVAAARAGSGSVQDDSRHEYWRTSKMEIFFSVITCKTALTKAIGFRNVFRIPGRIVGDSVSKEKKKDSLWIVCPNFPSISPAALFPFLGLTRMECYQNAEIFFTLSCCY